MKRSALAVSLCIACLGSGCALTSRSEPMVVRYFSPNSFDRAPAPAATPRASNLSLRLERVRSSSHLEEAIAFRNGVHELGYYEDKHWTEKPEAYLERGLERALFQERGVTRILGGASESLSVELVAFEEVRGPRPIARIEVILTLHDERASQLEQTIRVERPIPNTGKDATSRAVAALSEVLDAAIGQIAELVTQRLTALAAATPNAATSAEAAAR